jgi:hypothetical protein
VQRYLAFKPDSLFYAYDTCGNQDNVIWYEYGKEAHAPLKFTSSAFKNENGFEFQLHCYPFGQETWEFDLEKRLVRIKCYANSITYKYKRSRIVQIEEVLGEGYTNYTGITRERKWMTRYKYRGKSLVKAQQYFFDSNNAKEGWKEIRTVKLKRDKNGFPQMNLIGRELQYTYRLK